MLTGRNALLALGVSALLATPITSFAASPSDVEKADIRKLVDVKSLRGAKGFTRVAVPGYRVIFVTRNKVVSRAEDWLGGVGGGKSSGAKATMEVVLGNVDFATLQQIADAGYADFLDELKSGGLEVVPTETVLASAAFQKMKTTVSTGEKPYTKSSADKKTDYVIVSPAAIPLWFTNGDGPISDQGMNQTNSRALSTMSRELDALILFPTIHVDFASLGGEGGKFARRASVTAKAAVYVNPGYTLFFIANSKGAAFSRLTEGIGVEGDPGDFIAADHASNASLVSAMQQIGIDFGPVRSKTNLVLHANRENFNSLALESMSGANNAFRRAIQEAQK